MTIVPRGGRFGVKVWDARAGRYQWLGTRATEAEALQLEAEHTPEEVETVAGWARVWLSDYARPAAATRLVYRQAAERITKDLGAARLDAVDRVTARRLAVSWPRNVSAVARTMWGDAVRDGVCAENPWAGLRLAQSRGRRDIVALTEAEVAELADVAEHVHREHGLQARAIVLLLAYVGIRPGELCALRWEDLDVAERELRVCRSLDATGVEKLPKNGLVRLVTVPPLALGALEGVPRVIGSPYVFHGPRRRRLNKASLFYWWRPVRVAWEAAGHEHLELYALRHAAATLLLERGLSAADVAVQLGHTDGGIMVMRRYGHPSEELARDRLKMAFSGDAANVQRVRRARRGA